MLFSRSRRAVGLALFIILLVSSIACLAQAPQVRIRRTYYDYLGQQLHEEYQYVSTPTNQYSKQGYYKEYNEDGTLWKKHTYRNNKAEGKLLEYATSGGTTWLEYDMTVRNNLMNGPYIRYSGPGQKLSAGNFVNGEHTGSWKFYYSDSYEVCTYRNDKKEGPATLFYKNGKIAEQYAYRNDERYDNGDIKGFFEDGTPKKSGHFTNGEMDGKFLAWYPNGQLRYEENYVAGVLEGQVLAYDNTGNVTTNDFYKNGVLIRHEKSAQEIAEDAQKIAYAERDKREKRKNDSIRRAIDHAEAAEQATIVHREQAESLLSAAQRKQEQLAAADAGPGLNASSASNAASSLLGMAASAAVRKPHKKLYFDLYNKLLLDCQLAPNATIKLAKAQRLLALVNLTDALYRGEQPDLNKAIRKENDLDKVLALTKL